MDTNEKRGQLVMALQRKVAALEGAITKLTSSRVTLQENSSEVRCEIQTVMSRQLEYLRNREVWLLEQVDLIQQLKENTLSRQLEALNLALGSARNSLALGDDITDEAAFCQSLQDTLNHIECLNLNPDESPHISLQADARSLKKSIQQFGKVDAKGLPLESAFVKHGTTSTSLPKEFEDYEDDQHHILYKTVGGPLSQINVNIPRLDSKKFLEIPGGSHKLASHSRSAPPSTRSSMKGRSTSPTNLNDHVEHWMRQIKQHAEAEDDEDVFVHTPSYSGSAFSSPVHKPVCRSPSPRGDYFQQIKATPQDAWLLKKQQVKSNVSQPGITLPYFTRLQSSPKEEWLHQSHKAVAKGSDAVSYFRTVPQDSKCWLSKASGALMTQSTTNDKGRYTMAYFSKVSTTPTTQWLHGKPSTTVKKPVIQHTEEVQKWLMSKRAQAQMKPSEFFNDYVKNLQKSPKTEWLQKGSASSTTDYAPLPMFNDIHAGSQSWLLKDRNQSKPKDSGSCCTGICAPRPVKVDIENLGSLYCVQHEPKQAASVAALTPASMSDYFQHMKKSNSDSWLLKKSKSIETNTVYKNANPQSMEGYFSSIKGSDSAKFLKQTTKNDTENLKQDMQDAVANYFRSIRMSEEGKWLLENKAKEKGELEIEKDMDEISVEIIEDIEEGYVMPDIQEVCKANEKCDSFSECVSDENCCKSPLSSPSLKVEMAGHSLSYFNKIHQQDMSNWLSKN